MSGVQAAELRVALLKVARRLRVEKSDQELSDAQYSALAVLDRAGPMTPGALAEFERVQPPSMTRTLAGLLARDLVERSPGATDRRQVIVRLTAAGESAVADTRRRRDVWLSRRLADLDPSEQDVLERAASILRRIADT